MKHKLCVVGFGGMGGWHVNHALKSDVVELAGIVDIDEAKRQKARDMGIHAYETLAEALAKYGDYSGLQQLGIDVSSIKYKEALNEALQKAELGDYSALKALGYSTYSLEQKDALALAETLAKYGDYSGLEALGIDVSSIKNKATLENALQKAELGDYSALKALGYNTQNVE